MSTVGDVIYSTLRSWGLSPAGASGAEGNLQVESGLDPNAWNANEGARGLAQWEGGRRTALQSYAAAHGLKETDLAAQLGYLHQELTGGYSGVLAYERTVTDPASAAAYWDANYERSAGTTRQQRISDAQSIYQTVKSGGSIKVGGSAPKGSTAPYDPLTLKPPLTAAQRAGIRAYLKSWTPSDPSVRANRPDFNKSSDVELILYYTMAYNDRNPAASPGQIAGGLAGDIWGSVAGVVYKGVFGLAGLGIIVVGLAVAAKEAQGS